MSLQKEFLEKFRKDKYKIGSETEDIELIKEDLQNSISQLANDLYADGIHFVLELIQNADDNDYLSDNKPILKFVIDEEKILVQNNEKGFTNENVISLCSVGKSKKTKEQGYIGEKGIGFKSVFRISDEPHIFSNGFQFKFKRIDEEVGLGYIIPYWIEEVPDFVDKKLTSILLPLNAEARKELSKFSEIEPELLLFLRKLFVVEIHNKVDNTFHKYVKTFQNETVKIKSNRKEENFRLVSQTLEVPKTLKEEKREINKTELVLGFPVNEDGTAKTESEQKVFAFLPTKGYGFKFMIQADFLVPASREDVLKFKKWNIWLRDNISTVFLKSVETFKKDENLKTGFYNYIPIESEVTDKFFSKVVEQLKSKLFDSDCILTESGKWLNPSQVFRASEEIRSLISNEDLLEFFGKEFISTLIEENVESKILDFLEVSSFSTNHLIELLKNTEWLEKQSDEWLIKLYDYLKNKLSKSEINSVKKLQIIRLKNGEMASPVQKKIFFPFGKKQFYGFENQLPFIKREIAKDNEEFLKILGVLNPQPFEIIENYILKDFEDNDENQNWQSKTEEVRIGYINYIKDNLAEYEKVKGSLDRIKDSIWITLKDEKFWLPNKIYLPREYGNEYNLEFLFSGIQDIHFVHSQYIELSKKIVEKSESDKLKRKEKLDKEKKDWKNFFTKIGVQTKPEIYLEPTSQYGYRNKIYSSPIINKIIEEGNTNKNAVLLKILDLNWDYYKNFIVNTVWYLPYGDGRYNRRERKENSEWFVKIANTKWLPTKNGGFDEPSNLFLDKPEIRKILGDGIYYLDAKIKNEDFIEALKINSEANVETVIKALKSLVEVKNNDKKRFDDLYSFLNENYKGNEHQINNFFQDENLIFIPENSGQYITSGKTIWKDVSDIFGDYRYYLEKYYSKLKDFFVSKIGIPEKPVAKDYADILVELSEKDFVEKTDEEKILKIYKAINEILKKENSEEKSVTEESWWEDFIGKGIFWTNKSDFWRNDNDVFVNDDEEIYELFKDKLKVAFLDFPRNEIPKLEPFIKATGLKYLSKEFKAQIDDSVEFLDAEKLTKQINELLIYIVRYIYQEEYKIYEITKQDGRLLQLINLTCYGVDDLNVEYTLHTESAIKSDNLFLNGNKLYVKIDNFDSSDNLKDFDRISIELAKLFGHPKGLSDFIETLFTKSTNEKREESLKVKKIGILPEDEYEWFTKNVDQKNIIEKNNIILGKAENFVEKETQYSDLIAEEDELNNKDSFEFYPQRDSNQKNQKSEINQIETDLLNSKSQTEIPSTSYSEQIENSPIQNKDAAENDWSPEIEPSEVESGETENVIPEFKPSTAPSNKTIETNSKSSSLEKENNESIKNTLSQEAKRKIGKWGEEFAVEKLREKFFGKYTNCKLQETDIGFNILVNNQIKVEVKWLNKYADNGIGRDIEYIENGEEFFVEVKATKTDSKEIFQISRSEWQLAKDKQKNYSIYRVYNAGTKQARVEEICNPYKEWLEEKLLVQSLTIKI